MAQLFRCGGSVEPSQLIVIGGNAKITPTYSIINAKQGSPSVSNTVTKDKMRIQISCGSGVVNHYALITTSGYDFSKYNTLEITYSCYLSVSAANYNYIRLGYGTNIGTTTDGNYTPIWNGGTFNSIVAQGTTSTKQVFDISSVSGVKNIILDLHCWQNSNMWIESTYIVFK